MENSNLHNQLRKDFQTRFLRLFNWVLVACILVIAFVTLSSDSFMVPVYFAGGFMVLLNTIIYHIKPNYTFASLVMLVIYSSMLVIAYYSGGIEDIGIIWLVTLPVLGYFLFGKKTGTLVVAIFLSWIILFYFFVSKVQGSLFYTWSQTQQVLVACIMVGAVMYFYESFYDTQQAELEKYSLDIEKIAYQIKADALKKKDLLETTERQKEELERYIAEQKKHFETAERLAAIVEGTEDAIIGEDLNGIIISWNKGAESLYGYSESEVLGKSVNLMVPEDRREEKITAFQQMVGEGKSLHIQTQRKSKDGKLVDVDVDYSPINSTDGQIVGFSVIARDITKEKQVDKAKTEFVALASHQLKTPLAAVNWYTEMLMDGDAGKLNKEQIKYLNEIQAGNKRMTELVNSLLNVSRLDMGSFSVEPASVNLKALVKSVVGDLESQLKDKNISLKIVFQKDLTDYSADPILMRIVFQNLLSNAVKYTPKKGKVDLNVVLAKKASEFGGKKLSQDSMVITVKDTGIGIPKDQQAKVFQKMFRAENAKNSVTEGSGLGLYIIKTISEQSGGDVWFESTENKGTTFYVSLPQTGMAKKAGEKKLS